MTKVKENSGLMPGGWIPDIPDYRDRALARASPVLRFAASEEPAARVDVDLTELFPAVEDQGNTNATTAISCGGLVEYFNRRAYGTLTNVSKTFLYEATRRLHAATGDSGVSIRQVWKTLVRVGVPPERCARARRDGEDELSYDPLLYAFARDYENIEYIRICGFEQRDPLHSVKTLLCLGMPSVFGMPLFSSIGSDSNVDFCNGNEVVGGMSGVIVGFNDHGGIAKQGALRFRSTWGPGWGEGGYGWLSYRLLEEGFVRDIWTIFDRRWVERGDFPFGHETDEEPRALG